MLGCRQSCPEAHSGLSPLPTGCPVPGLVGWGEKAGRGVPTDRMASQQQTDFSQLHTMNDPSCWREAETKPLVSGTRGMRTYAQTYMYTCTQACTRTHVCADTCLPCVLRLASTPTLGWRAARCGPAFLEGSWGVGGWCGVSGNQGQSVRTCRPCRVGRGQEGALQWSGVVLRQPGHRVAWPGARPASDSWGRGSDVSAGENELSSAWSLPQGHLGWTRRRRGVPRSPLEHPRAHSRSWGRSRAAGTGSTVEQAFGNVFGESWRGCVLRWAWPAQLPSVAPGAASCAWLPSLGGLFSGAIGFSGREVGSHSKLHLPF